MQATVGGNTDGPGRPGASVDRDVARPDAVDQRVPVWAHLGWATAGTGAFLAVAARWVDRPLPLVIPILQSLAPYLVAATFLLAVLAGWRGRHALAWCAPALIAALVVSAQFALRWAGAPDPPQQPTGTLRVLSLNVQVGQADIEATMATISTREVDVVVLLETTPGHLAALDAAGLADRYPYRTAAPAPADRGPAGSVIASRWPLTVIETPSSEEAQTFEEPAATVETAAGPVTVRAVHPYPPIPTSVRQWRAGLLAMRDWAEARDDERLILAGDFNAAAAHPPFRAFLGDFDDAAEATGTVLPRTWPIGHRRFPPFVAIDHVLTRGLAARDLTIIRVPGTDHAGLVADLAW